MSQKRRSVRGRNAAAGRRSAGVVVSVRDVARRVDLSQRRFIHVFTSAMGLTPKRYHRIRRFQRARRQARYTPSPDWADVALECGYFDQSHLIHDFREFAGFSPVEFQRRWSEHVLPNHLPQIRLPPVPAIPPRRSASGASPDAV
jgi:AraC-like DNA-binding protein